jgi:hypothetical protein
MHWRWIRQTTPDWSSTHIVHVNWFNDVNLIITYCNYKLVLITSFMRVYVDYITFQHEYLTSVHEQ